MSAPRAQLDVADGVATITLSDPAGVNAIDADLAADLRACVEEAGARRDVGAIVTAARGLSWSVGGAVKTFADLGDGVHDYIREVGEDVNPLVAAIHRSPKITIAAVHGPVAGGGIGLMAAHDVVLADPGTTITIAYRRLGLSPDAGGTYFLARDLGYRRALDLYLSDATLDAEQARAAGIVSRVVAADAVAEEARALALRLAAGPRAAHAATKRLLRQTTDALLERQLEDEIRSLADGAAGADFAEGLRAFLERRAPRFGPAPAGVAGS
ncbi:enoyl-CoA hydratase/isomerase family protein [Patulibacter defluvii]|uniref:enoyl-CoA hydratase/isomerase family protein n=1 Tax=Patulibacter defluvii TaxID=3095358 RepID=UPI002A74D522|nr:enoyl-CoA hydratase/isomerase family protein [Patulibacter sp. DM4]